MLIGIDNEMSNLMKDYGVLQGVNKDNWTMEAYCDWLFKTEPFIFNDEKSHIPLNLWKQ